MASNALVQTRIDAEVKERATAVLENMGLTVSDAVRILLTRTANEGALPLELFSHSEAHDAWFRAKVLRALGIPDPTSTMPTPMRTFESAGRQLCARLRRVIDEARLGAICA